MTESHLTAESRLNIQDVPEQISRIFFGQGSNRPSYTDDGYGSPDFGFPSSNPLLYRGEILRNLLSPTSVPPGYTDDIFLLIKLGQAALIIFMIFAIIAILFMVTSCCSSLVNITNNKRREDQDQPSPFVLTNLVVSSSSLQLSPQIIFYCSQDDRKPRGSLTRTAGVTNLSLEAETDSSTTTEEIQVRVTPGSRRRQRDETDERPQEREERLSSSTSSSSQLSHNRSLPYYEVPTPTRPAPGPGYRMRTFGSPATSPPPLPNISFSQH